MPRAPRLKVESVESLRLGTFKVHCTVGKQQCIRVVVYPGNVPMLVIGDDGVQWLESDLTAHQRSVIINAVRKVTQ